MKSSLRTSIVFAAIALASAASFAQNGSSNSFEDFGNVQSVSPNFESLPQQQQVCDSNSYDQQPQQQGNNNGSGTLIGAIAGGLLGNQVGGGNGRTAATAVGAVVGALSGQSISNGQGNGYQQPQSRCRMVYTNSNRQNGFLVTYEYKGRSFTTVTRNDPGRQIRLAITAVPSQW